MKLHSKLFFLTAFSVAKIINEKLVHQIAGFVWIIALKKL